MNKFYKPAEVMSVVDMFFTFNVCNEFYFRISKANCILECAIAAQQQNFPQINLRHPNNVASFNPKGCFSFGVFCVHGVCVIGAEHNCCHLFSRSWNIYIYIYIYINTVCVLIAQMKNVVEPNIN